MQTTIQQAARDVEVKRAEGFDPIGWLLFAHMDWTDRHPKTMLACVAFFTIILSGYESTP